MPNTETYEQAEARVLRKIKLEREHDETWLKVIRLGRQHKRLPYHPAIKARYEKAKTKLNELETALGKTLTKF